MYSIHEKLIRVDILALCAAHPCLATVTHLASAVVAPWVVFVAWIFFFALHVLVLVQLSIEQLLQHADVQPI